jgi:endo-alpha-1,4-polygalactosaminidase (GH114 family)
VTTRPAYLAAVLSLLPLAVACSGETTCAGDAAACSAALESGDAGGGAGGGDGAGGGGAFQGDGSDMPAWGGWAWGAVPAEAVAGAGFDWFETGYPSADQVRANEVLAGAGVRPFAYINLGELHDDLRGAANYTGPILRTNPDWGTHLVDVTHPSWMDWLVRRADEAYRQGSRGVKWDVANPDIPPGKTIADVTAAMASVMQRIRDQHPDMKFVVNQGFDFAEAYPQYVDGVQTEGLFSAGSYQGAYLQPWLDPWYWGPQFERCKALRAKGTPIFVAEYTDPYSQRARELYDTIVSHGFVPYITSDHWDIRGWGYNISPGW